MNRRSGDSKTLSSSLSFRLLGEFAVQVASQPVPDSAFERRRARSLLKLLVLVPDHRLHREQVMERLMPNLGPLTAPAQLYKTIHQARQALATAESGIAPEALLVLHDKTLSLEAPGGVHSDLQEFERLAERALEIQSLATLEAALSAYGGELLPNDLYESWTFERREALRERLVDLLVALGEARLAAGALVQAAEAFRQAIERDVLREAAHRGLMRLRALQGDQAGLERQYHRCCEALRQELDTEPSTATRRLHEALHTS